MVPLTIDLAPVADADDEDGQNIVLNALDDAVVPDAKPEQALLPLERHRARWTRLVGQRGQPRFESRPD